MIRLTVPNIAAKDIQRATEVLKSGFLVQGKFVQAFEDALSKFSDIPGAAAVSSGTAALHLALLSVDVKPGDWVIVPAFTFPATANVVENIGANVLLCDVDPCTYNVTPDAVRKVIRDNADKSITALIVVHEFGAPTQMSAFAQISKTYKLKLIEDAACALGTVADKYHPGYFSDVACFSFHPRKAITTGEGGAVLSTDKTLIERIKVLRNHGIVYKSGKMDFVAAGLNYRMTDFQAALALGQLERFRDELRKRVFLAELYFLHLDSCPHLFLPQNDVGHSWQSFMVVLDNHVDRDMLIELMEKRDVEVNLGAQALNCLTYFHNKYGVTDTDCPIAARLFRSGLVLPLYGSLTEHDVELVTTTLKKLILS